mmetsp:Transcript_6315/g.25246  ORF Transcript_6315/g.25246 Transcript_6315/m.25246 type:complete len:212 (+) Transcript_6315:619-1254(+)
MRHHALDDVDAEILRHALDDAADFPRRRPRPELTNDDFTRQLRRLHHVRLRPRHRFTAHDDSRRRRRHVPVHVRPQIDLHARPVLDRLRIARVRRVMAHAVIDRHARRKRDPFLHLIPILILFIVILRRLSLDRRVAERAQIHNLRPDRDRRAHLLHRRVRAVRRDLVFRHHIRVLARELALVDRRFVVARVVAVGVRHGGGVASRCVAKP